MATIAELTPDEKVQRVLEEITDELQVTPKGQPLEIHRGHETDVAIGERHYQKIIIKLEQEEKVIKVLPDDRKEGTYSTQWGYPSRYAKMEVTDSKRLFDLLATFRELTGFSQESLNIKVHKAAQWWGMNDSERKIHTMLVSDYPLPKIAPFVSKPALPTIANKPAIALTVAPFTQPASKKELRVEFLDASGELVLNEFFTLACPTVNGQNYRIIKYLIANPNRFVGIEELKNKALDGKDLDKRLTDFAAQVNMNKDLGRLFFDTSKDSIRLNNPVISERMTELNIKRVRIKPE